jgi:hypothetical protein
MSDLAAELAAFMTGYEQASNSHDIDRVVPMHATYWSNSQDLWMNIFRRLRAGGVRRGMRCRPGSARHWCRGRNR